VFINKYDNRPRIVLGISGSIAAYKACEVASQLSKDGFAVRVVMTKNATHFIGPLTLAALTSFEVALNIFNSIQKISINHIELANWAQIVVVAPATANIIAKVANGLADDLLTNIILATVAPLLIVPSMNPKMFAHPTVTENLKRLKARNIRILGPVFGRAACGDEGVGCMVKPTEIVNTVWDLIVVKDLVGVRLLISAGPTQEYLDSVRYVSNPSSGRMGVAIAKVAKRRGAVVTLILGPTQLTPSLAEVRIIQVVSTLEMFEAIIVEAEQAHIVIKTAAVNDFQSLKVYPYKVKKTFFSYLYKLVPTVDILATLGRNKDKRVLVGFAAETHNLVANAIAKLKTKNLDLIVVNNISALYSGFMVCTNKVTIIDSSGVIITLPLMSKVDVANYLLSLLVKILGHNYLKI